MKRLVCLSLLLFLTACQTELPLRPPVLGFLDLPQLAALDQAVAEAIAEGRIPGGVLWVERQGQRYHRAFGNRAVYPETEAMEPDTIFDLASLTKVLATAPAVALLQERGQLNFDDPVAKHLPEFAQNGKEAVTLKQLLTHYSGLRSGLSLQPEWSGTETAVALACAESLRHPPGTRFVYSDINYILLGAVVQKVSGQPLDQFTQTELYRPLGMNDTGFNPDPKLELRIAPTTRTAVSVLRGTVHDPTAARMNGVAGHAGLFSTAEDLAVFARMLLAEGRGPRGRIMAAATVASMTGNQTPQLETQRGLGWDIASPYSSPRGHLFELGSYGHTGWTGPSLWIDPFSQTFVIFLTNRNHPDEGTSVVGLRRTLATLAARAVLGYEFPDEEPTPPSAPLPTLNGVDALKRADFAPLKGLKIGLITNHTGRDREGNSTIDLLHEAPDVELVKLFSPEHGIRGKLSGQVADDRDQKTGLRVLSLYGQTRKPTPEHLQGLDALVFDIQDIGCRFYTYISTLKLAMEAAAEAELKIVVLDRLNPVSGDRVEGPATIDEATFVACHAVPIRHGMTVGELATLFVADEGWTLDLDVVRLQEWRRDAWLDETSVPWLPPSPNMRNLTQAALYPGIGLLELTAISVGRGTPTPFEIIGAPYLDHTALAAELQLLKLPGIRIEPFEFTPESSKFANELCRGLRFAITDRDAFRPLDLGVSLALILYRDHASHFDLDAVNRLLRHPPTLELVRQGKTLADIKSLWEREVADFQERRAACLFY